MSGAPLALLDVLVVADVSPLAVRGGAERVLWEQARRLAARGHRLRVVARAHEGVAADTVRDGVRVTEFAADRRSLPRFVVASVLAARRAVGAALADGRAVLHLHQPLSGWGALGAPRARGRASLYTFHSSAALEYRSRRGMTGRHRGGPAGWLGAALLTVLERACLRRATRVHVLSEFSAGLVTRLHRVPRERLVRIPGAADLARFVPAADRAATRRALGLPPGRPLLLTVRNLESRMGLEALLAALDRVRAEAPDVLLLVGGVGSLRARLDAQAAALGLGEHVRFLGFVDDARLPAYYQVADLFVLPTQEMEGFGLVTVEALACGTPVLVTRRHGVRDVLTGESGFVAEEETPEGLARVLVDLSRRRKELNDRRAAIRGSVAHLTWDRVATRMREVYLPLV